MMLVSDRPCVHISVHVSTLLLLNEQLFIKRDKGFKAYLEKQ